MPSSNPFIVTLPRALWRQWGLEHYEIRRRVVLACLYMGYSDDKIDQFIRTNYGRSRWDDIIASAELLGLDFAYDTVHLDVKR